MSTSPQPHATFSPSSHALRHKRLRHNVRGAGAQSAHHAGAQSAPPPISVLASAPSRPRSLARLGLSAWPRCFSSLRTPCASLDRQPAGGLWLSRPLSFGLSLPASRFLSLTHPCTPFHAQMLRSLRSKQQRNTHQATEKPATILIQRAPVHRFRSRTRFRPLSLTGVVSHSLCLSRTRCTHGRAEGLALRPCMQVMRGP
jgi:hypothetical protein